MSGIEDLKIKSKLKLQEMFSNKAVGNPETQETRFHPTEPPKEPEVPIINQFPQQDSIASQTNTLPSEKQEPSVDSESNPQIFPSLSTKPSPSPKAPTHKMTFQLTEEIYKAFNNLYASRMLQGRKTEKSEMICEAIQWLIKKEETHSN